MNIVSFVLTLVCVLGISIGQILFKLAAGFFPKSLALGELISFALNKYFISAIVIYAFASMLWIYTLKLVPLNVAYPLMSLAFVIVPILSYFFLHEAIEYKTLVGTLVMILGLLISFK